VYGQERFKALTAVLLKTQLFWDITLLGKWFLAFRMIVVSSSSGTALKMEALQFYEAAGSI
jgi:hypothetical protein